MKNLCIKVYCPRCSNKCVPWGLFLPSFRLYCYLFFIRQLDIFYNFYHRNIMGLFAYNWNIKPCNDLFRTKCTSCQHNITNHDCMPVLTEVTDCFKPQTDDFQITAARFQHTAELAKVCWNLWDFRSSTVWQMLACVNKDLFKHFLIT